MVANPARSRLNRENLSTLQEKNKEIIVDIITVELWGDAYAMGTFCPEISTMSIQYSM